MPQPAVSVTPTSASTVAPSAGPATSLSSSKGHGALESEYQNLKSKYEKINDLKSKTMIAKQKARIAKLKAEKAVLKSNL